MFQPPDKGAASFRASRGLPFLDYGRIRHRHSKGREVVFFDKKARARLENDRPASAHEGSRLSRTYAVIGSDGTVITVGHRYRRLRRV